MSSQLSLPNALKTKPLPTVSTMSVDTNILDPVISTSTFARFVLEKKGILDAGSAFTFCLTNGDAGDDGNIFLPVKTGIHSLIKQATLRVGAKIIASSDNYGEYQTIKRQFKTSEEKALKDMVKYGCNDGLEPSAAVANNGTFHMANAIYAEDGLTGLMPAEYQILNDPLQSPNFQIKLSDLFPMLRNVQLPLFVFNEPVSVELVFNTQSDGAGDLGKIACAAVGATNTAVNLETGQTKFLADYLTYDDGTMAATAKQVFSDQGIVMPYEDLLLTTSSIPAITNPVAPVVVQTNHTTDIAVAGRLLRSVVIHSNDSTNNVLLGRYASKSYQTPDAYNFRVNDMQFLPNDVSREPQKQYELGKVFGKDIEIHNIEYSKDLLTNKQDGDNSINNFLINNTELFHGQSQRALLGNCHYHGADFSKTPFNTPGNGTLIGQKPVQFIRKLFRGQGEQAGITQRCYSLVERQLIIKGGSVQVSA